MTKTRSIPQSPSKSLRDGPSAKGGGTQTVDACELFLAELASRRERLQELLLLVHQEAGRMEAARVPVQRHKCATSRRKPDF